MTYFVPKKEFVAGGVASADDLMKEFYGASDALYRIDQNNIAKQGIGHQVPISMSNQDSSDNQRGVTCFYTEEGVLTTGSFATTTPNKKDVFQKVDYLPGDGLSFTTRMTGIYTFILQGGLSSHGSAAADDWLNLDVMITLNGSSAGPTASFSSFQTAANNALIPIYHEITRLIEPGEYEVGLKIRPRLRGSRFPTVTGMGMVVFGLLR